MSRRCRRLPFCLVLLFQLVGGGGPRGAWAASEWVLRGSVLDAISSEPIERAEVSSGDLRASTDSGGDFELTLHSAEALLEVRAPGYHETELTITNRDTGPVDVRLVPIAVFEEVVQVRDTLRETEEPSAYAVTPGEVFRVAGSADNIFRTLSTLPGVSAVADFNSRLSVRGGLPDQNLTLLDGVEIHNPFRLSGLTSAFNPETIESFELTAGGFGVKNGDRLSSLLVVENRVGASTFGGSASLSITDANLVLEGPMPGGESGSWLLTGRRTYYDLVAGFNSDDEFPSFEDLQGQASWTLPGGHRIKLFALRSREDADFDVDRSNGDELALASDARNDLVSASFDFLLGSRWASDTTASWYRNRDVADFDGSWRQLAKRSNAADGDVARTLDEFVFNREFRLRDWSLRQNVTWDASPRHTVEFGGEVHALATGVRWISLGNDRIIQEANGSSVRGGAGLPDEIDSTVNGVRGGLWVQDRWQASRAVSLQPGLRFDWSTTNRRSTLSPRLAASIALGAGARMRAAVGLFTQSPGYEKLIQSDYFVDLSRSRELRLPYERATHFIVGIEKELHPGLVARLEGYYKSFSDLVVGRLETEPERLARVEEYDFPPELQDSVPVAPIITSAPSSDSGGRAYGLDLYLALREPSAKLAGWIAYTLGRAERDAYSSTHPMEYERRHSFDLVARYRWGERFDTALTARLASGAPYTPAVGLRVAAIENDEGKLVPETDAEGNLVYSADFGTAQNLNTGRLPLYARLDLRATFHPGGRDGRWSIYLEAINLLDRDNAVRLDTWLGYDPASSVPQIVEAPSEGLPFVPSLGVRFRF